MKLTAKQELFITEYMKDLNATQAAIRAGYSEKTAKDIGCENLAKPNIKSKIDVMLLKRANDNGVTADMVLKDLMELKDKCLGRKKVKITSTDENGKPIDKEKYIFDSTGAKASLELLGKHLKLFTDKVESDNTNHNIEITLDKNLEDWAK